MTRCEIRDRELAGGDVGEQLEQPVERRLLVVGVLGREQQDLRIELLEHPLELVLVTHVDDRLEPQLDGALCELVQLVVVDRTVEHDGIGACLRGRLGREPEGEHGQRRTLLVALAPARTTSPSAPLAPAVTLGDVGTSTSSEMPSPSAIAWLSRRLLTREDANCPGRSRRLRPMAEVKRVLLIGAESTGKSTLARALAEAYDTVWNPEYGRPYTELGRDPEAPWHTDEFTSIARLQCWYEDFLAALARAVLFCDTDAFTTALFHEAYLGRPTDAFDGARRAPVRPDARLRHRRAVRPRRDP